MNTNRWTIRLLWAINALAWGMAAWMTFVAVLTGAQGPLIAASCMLAYAMPFLWFTLQQRKTFRAAERALEAGDEAEAQAQLLTMELRAWSGGIARAFLGLTLLGLAIAGIANGVNGPLVGTWLGVAAFGLYGRLWREPALTKQIADARQGTNLLAAG